MSTLLTPLTLAVPLACAVSSEEADLHLEVPDGLAVQIWAESPLLFNPTAMDVDARGRIWVTEAVNYRKWDGRNPGREHPEGDRVVVLEDTDGDGRCDASTVFAQDEDLVAPLGICVFGDRVFVSCSPTIWEYRDTDGDDVADEREVFLTGFGGFDHDHGVHSMVVGPDGKGYVAVGNAGPHVVTDRSGWTLRSGSLYRGGGPAVAPNAPGLVSDDGRVWVGGLVLRVGLDGTGLEVVAHNFRNNYEVALDRRGNLFGNDNDDDGNGGCRTLWILEGGNHGFFSADGSRSWQADRRPGQDNWTAHWHQDDPGVAPAGTRTGAGGPTGVAVYEGELMADWIDGHVLSCDAGAGVVFAMKPVEVGAGIELENGWLIRGRHGDDERSARWFRPSDAVVGLQGEVYVADWYDPAVGGHAAGDREAYGRIVRIAPEGFEVEDAAPQSPEWLSWALRSPAPHVRATGRERARSEALSPDVRDVLGATPMRDFVWIVGVGGRPSDWLAGDTARPDGEIPWPGFTGLCLRISRKLGVSWTGDDLLRVASEAPANAMPEIALASRALDREPRLDVLRELAIRFDGEDRTYLEALGIGADGIEAELYAELVAGVGDSPLAWDARFEGLAWRLHPDSAAPSFFARAMSPTLTAEQRRRAVDALAFCGSREAAEAMLTVAQAAPDDAGDVRALALWWAKSRATNDWAEYGLLEQLQGIGREGAELAWTSGLVHAGVHAFDVDVAGAERVWLVVTDGGNGNGCDWADWVDPMFTGDGLELPVAGLPWVDASAGWGTLARDANAVGEPMAIDGAAIPAGIGTHAASEIAVDVPAGAARLVGSAGPDDGGTSQGCGTSVEFQVWVRRAPDRGDLLALQATVFDAGAGSGERAAAAEALARLPEGGLFLIDLAARSELPEDVAPAVEAAIWSNPDLGVRALASEQFRNPNAGDLPPIAELVRMPGDAARGREVFYGTAAQCSTCHAYGGEGGTTGPELTDIRAKLGADAIYDAILNPSAAIAFGYDAWIVETTDGQLVSGFVLADGDLVVVKDTQGLRWVFPRDEIAERRRQVASTMPTGLALAMDAQDLADVVAFLRSEPEGAEDR